MAKISSNTACIDKLKSSMYANIQEATLYSLEYVAGRHIQFYIIHTVE